VPYLSASAVVIHYKEALYKVYALLPLPPNWGALGPCPLPKSLQTRPSRVKDMNLIAVGQIKRCERKPAYEKMCRKMCSSRRAFQGHSRSLELTRIDRLHMTSC